MKKIILLGAVVAMLAALAGPAAARNEVGLLGPGTAFVGRAFASGCNNDGTGTPTGPGLYVPGTGPAGDGTWQISTQVITDKGFGALNACGWLTDVAGVGPACGMSKGYDGRGIMQAGDGKRYKLTHLTWKATAGGTLPVIGHAEALNNPGKAPKAPGKIVAVVQAQGGSNCIAQISPNGAQTFSVVGAFAGLQGQSGPKWNDLPGFGKPGDVYDDKTCHPYGKATPKGDCN